MKKIKTNQDKNTYNITEFDDNDIIITNLKFDNNSSKDEDNKKVEKDYVIIILILLNIATIVFFLGLRHIENKNLKIIDFNSTEYYNAEFSNLLNTTTEYFLENTTISDTNFEINKTFEVSEQLSEAITDTTKNIIDNNANKNYLININTASAEELMKLNGIGKVKADAIIEYRESIGLFEKIEDITNVKGIGQTTFDKLKNYITIEGTD